MGRRRHIRGLMLFTVVLAAGCDTASSLAGLGNVDNTDFVASARFEFLIDVTSQARFRLDGINGDVRVSGVAGATAISITGERLVGSESSGDALQHLDLLRVQVVDGPTETTVRTIQPNDTRGRNYVVNYVVTLPADLMQVIGNVNGNVCVTGIESDVTVGGVNGNVNATGIEGEIDIGLVNGNINAEVVPPAGGHIALGAVNGNISLGVPVDISARLEASWVNGGITFQNVTLRDPVITDNGAIGTFGDGDGRIDLGVTNGQLSVAGR